RVLDRGRGDERLLGRYHAAAVLRKQLETLRPKPGELFGGAALVVAAVRTRDLRAATLEDRGERQHARPADAAEEPGVGREVGGSHGRAVSTWTDQYNRHPRERGPQP